MMNVCFNCGEYRAGKTIDPSGPYAVCPECGHKHSFLQLPLLAIGGASAAGKSAACHALLGRMSEVVLLEGDLLWRPEFDRPEDKYRDFFETWLRMAKSISQSGRPVVIFNAGMAVPENVERCVERRYFSDVHYLALVCEDEMLVDRLQSRPEWRASSTPEKVAEQVEFNRWFNEQAGQGEPAIELIDTTEVSVEDTAEQVAAWIRSKIGSSCSGGASG
jgi:hypothetical protein